MKNKLYIFTIILLSLYSSVYSQNNYYYYYKGQKIFLELDKSKLNLIANDNFTSSEISNIGLNPYVLSQDAEITSHSFGKVEYQTEPTLTEFYQKVNFLKTKQNIKNIGLYFKRTGAPNPATENVNISYKLNETGSAYLMIIGSYGTTGTTNNYILDTNSSETNINISNYPNGFYTVALVCNGNIVDAKTLIKQ